MPNEKNAVIDFLNEVSPPKDIFKEETQVDNTEEQMVEEKAVPFHKDPKVQRYVERQIEKALKDRLSVEREFKEAVSSDVKDVIGAFATIIGNDTPEKVKALEALEKTLNGADERASTKAIERFQKQMQDEQQKATEADIKAQNELDDYFEEIEETYNVDLSSNSAAAKKTRADFIEYVRKIAPKNEQGEVAQFPDLVNAFETFQERQQRAPATRAKELASRGMTRSADTNNAPITGKSWKDVDAYFDKLKKTLN